MVSPLPGADAPPDPDAEPPRVGVVVLNWNAAWFTRRCLRSLAAQDYPSERLRVVLADNGSVDGSLEELEHWLAQRGAPEVELIANGANLGFAEGCNRAVRRLLEPGPDRVEHVALLNNDAYAEPGWLHSMVAVMKADDRCGAVSSRLLLEPGFVAVEVETGDSALTVVSAALTPGEPKPGPNVEPRASASGAAASIDVLGRLRTDGFDDEGALDWPPRRVWRLGPHATGTLWVPAGGGPGEVTIGLADEAGMVHRVTRALPEGRTTLLNGIGTGLNESGEGFDIGYGRPDPWADAAIGDDGRSGGSDSPIASVPVQGFCGGSVLLRASALEDSGLFDPTFFAYYEDTDLAWRMRRAGWRMGTAADAVAHHAFGASGGGGSKWHVFLDRRNWLVTNFRNGDPTERRRALGWLWRGAWRLFRVNVFGRLRRGRAPQAQPLLTWELAALTAAVRAPGARRDRRPGWRPTDRVRGAFQPTGTPKAPEPWPGGPLVTYVDVGETLKAGYRAGIQRVVCALVAELPGSDERIELVPIRWCERNQRFRRITSDEYASLLRSGGAPDMPDDSAAVAGAKQAVRATLDRLGVIGAVRRGREQVFGVRRRALEDSLVIEELAQRAVLLEVDAVWNEVQVDREQLLRDARGRGVRVATFVHDLLPLRHPDWFAPALRRIFDPVALAQLAHSELLLCASAETARQVAEVCAAESIDAPPVQQVPLGVPESATTGEPADIPAALRKGRYVLVVGTLEPRKNHAVVLDAFESLRDSHPDLQVVFVGRYGWGSDELVDRIRSHPTSGSRLHWFDEAHDDLLEALYTRCAAVLVPSHSEGFGLPAIEALAHGVPVVASSGGSLNEILGSAPEGAVRFAAPESPEHWVAAIGDLLGEQELARATDAAKRYVPPRWSRAARAFSTALLETFATPAVAAEPEDSL
jgi:GT2 family glycosyltransferase/glycosyltransferase involved in cell wall biosynthesis